MNLNKNFTVNSSDTIDQIIFVYMPEDTLGSTNEFTVVYEDESANKKSTPTSFTVLGFIADETSLIVVSILVMVISAIIIGLYCRYFKGVEKSGKEDNSSPRKDFDQINKQAEQVKQQKRKEAKGNAKNVKVRDGPD